jgi:hypothetical protein
MFSDDATIVRSSVEIAVLLPDTGLIITFRPIHNESGPPVEVLRAFSTDKTDNLEAYLQMLTGTVDSSPLELSTGDGKRLRIPQRENGSKVRAQAISQCDARLREIPLIPPASQRITKIPAGFGPAAFRFVQMLISVVSPGTTLHVYNCPCRVSLAYSSPTDPQGYGLIEDRTGERSVFGYYWDGSSNTFQVADTPHYSTETPAVRRFHRRIVANAKYSIRLGG